MGTPKLRVVDVLVAKFWYNSSPLKGDPKIQPRPEVNGTAAKAASFVEILAGRAAEQGDRTASIFLDHGEYESARLTFRELRARALAISTRVREEAGPGDRALLVYPPGIEQIAALHGCFAAGLVAVLLPPPRRAMGGAHLAAKAIDCSARIGLCTAGLKTQLERLPEFASFRWLATDTISADETGHQPMPVRGDDLAVLQYTSGSTGEAKAVRISHENLLQNSAVVRCLFGHTPESVGVSWLPMFHDMGLMASLQALYCGVPLVQMPPLAFLQKPVRWLRAISRYQATTSGGPDFAYDLCARKVTAEQRAGLDLSRWDVAFSGAEMVRAETLDRFADAFAECGFRREAFYPCYGMAEATTLATGGSRSAPPVVLPVRRQALWQGRVEDFPGSEEAWRLVGCGTPPLGHRVLIVDPELRRVCPPDRIGEVWLSGPSIAAGYWNRPEETEATFHAFLAGSGEGPFLRTGDLGFVRGGELFLSGRLKELVIIRGQNHSPQDLEQTVAKAHPALQTGSGAAFSVDVEGAERLVIVYELDRGAMRGGELAELTASIREALAAEHGLETHEVVLVGPRSVPRTSSGKIQRRLCRELYANGSLEALPV